MTKEDIKTNNKIIGDFMYPDNNKDIDKRGAVNVDSHTANRMHIYTGNYDLMSYHNSWDSLMPVIRRCYRTDHTKIEWSKSKRPWMVIDDRSFYCDDIASAYRDVLTFITWYRKEVA